METLFVGSEAPRELNMSNTVFRDVTPCGPVEVHRWIGGSYCLKPEDRDVILLRNDLKILPNVILLHIYVLWRKGKIVLTLCLAPQHGGVISGGIAPHIISVRDGGTWSLSPVPFISGEGYPLGGWVGPRAGPDSSEYRKISFHFRESKH
jgi:hypothetical protein